MRTTSAAVAVLGGLMATAISLSTPAEASPNPGPCGLAMVPICSIVPLLPELDHDVDLTQDPNGLNGYVRGDLAPNAKGSGD